MRVVTTERLELSKVRGLNAHAVPFAMNPRRHILHQNRFRVVDRHHRLTIPGHVVGGRRLDVNADVLQTNTGIDRV